MTFAGDVDLDQHQKIRYAVTIEGVPDVFVEETITGEYAGRTQREFIVEAPQGSDIRLDLEMRREIGGSLRLRLRDDSSNTLRTLFQPRADRDTWLVDSVAKGDAAPATLTVTDASVVTNTFYMGAETWTHDGAPVGNVLQNTTRSNHGSPAQDHFGNTADGAATLIYSAPPAWTGRKVTLQAVVIREGGTGALGTIGTFRLDLPPQYLGGDEYELSATSLADWYAQLPIMGGIETVKHSTGLMTSPITLDNTDEVRALGDRLSTSGSQILLFELPSGAWFTGQVTGGSGNQITFNEVDLLNPPWSDFEPEVNVAGAPHIPLVAPVWETAQQACLVQGDPAYWTLLLLHSIEGDATNSTYDELPGRDQDAWDGPEWHFGAGIDQGDIDAASFLAFEGATAPWNALLTEETTAGEILREFCQSVGAYWYVNSSGQITVDRLRDRVPPSTAAQTLAINDDITSLNTVESAELDERSVYHTVTLRCNWDPVTREYLVEINSIDGNLKKLMEGSLEVL